MRKTLYIFFFMVSGCSAFAQEKIDTDRPDQTESVNTVPKKWFQSEWGFSFEKAADGTHSLYHPSALHKYGLTNKFELRLVTEFISQETQLVIPAGNDVHSGLLPIQVGGKLALWDEKGAIPKTSFLFHTTIAKAASKKFREEKWAPDFRFSMQHSLTENLSLGYNLGAEWTGEGDRPYWLYTLAPGLEIGKRWYAYAEVYGFLRKGNHPQHNFDGGFAYYTTRNTRVDLSAGRHSGANNPMDYYVALGFSFRLPTKKGAPTTH